MTLDEILRKKLTDWQPTSPGRNALAVEFPEGEVPADVTARVVVDQSGPVGLSVWEIEVRRAASHMAREKGLADWARRLANRITGLLEPVELLEVDEDRGVAQLRSRPPSSKDRLRFYHEFLLRRDSDQGSVTVRRYQAEIGSSAREQIAFDITREALIKLVTDLASAE